jgi:hypothetical protein
VRLATALVFLVLSWPRAAYGQAPETPPAAALPPQVERVLKHVPDDARLVVVVPSVEALSSGLSAFGTATGIPDLADVTARRLLEEALDKSATALDTAGALVLALAPGQDEPILIAGLRNEESWKAATQPSTLRDGVLVYEFGPDRFIAASTGGVALFAREKEELRGGLDATGQFVARFSGAVGPWLAQRQAVVYVDVTAWREEIDTGLGLAAQRIPGGMAVAGQDVEAGMQMWNWILERLKRLVREARTYVGSVRVDARGVLLDGRVTFQPDSSVSHYLAQVRRPQRDLLRGLPAGAGPVVMSYEWEEEPGAEGLSSTMARALLNMDALKERFGAEQLEAVVRQSIELNRTVPGTSAVFGFGPTGKGVLYWGLYLTREGDAVRRDVRKICELTPELLGAWGAFPAAMTPGAAEDVAGVATDVYQFKVETNDSPRQPMVEALYGRDPALLMAPHPEGVAYAFGPREDARQKLAELLKTDAAPLSKDPHVTDLFKVLTPGPQLCVLADIPRLLTSVTGVLEQFGVPVPPLELGDADMPWAGFTFYLDPEAPRAEFFVPAVPIKGLVKAVHELEGKRDEAY